MNIYVNENYEIIALDIKPEIYCQVFEVEQTRKEMFGDFCDAVIYGHKYEPSFEMLFNEDGSNARDEKTGELLYKRNQNGDKILNGYMCHPFMNYKTLMLIQKQYEDNQKEVEALNAKIEYLSMMSNIEMEAANE